MSEETTRRKTRFVRPGTMKLSEDRIKRIADAVRMGATWRIAATYAGVSASAITHWMMKARDERARLEAGGEPAEDELTNLQLRLLMDIELAEAELGLELLSEIEEARKRRNDVNSTWSLLRVKFRNEFGTAAENPTPAVVINITGEDLAAARARALAEEQEMFNQPDEHATPCHLSPD